MFYQGERRRKFVKETTNLDGRRMGLQQHKQQECANMLVVISYCVIDRNSATSLLCTPLFEVKKLRVEYLLIWTGEGRVALQQPLLFNREENLGGN